MQTTRTKLDAWMADSHDDHWLAAKLSCHPSQASRIRRGRSRPSPARAVLIEDLTNGAVTAIELLTAESLTDAEAA